MIKDLLKCKVFKSIAMFVAVAMLAAIPAQSGYTQTLPTPGQMIYASPAFLPTYVRGLSVDVADPFNLSFMIEDGQEKFSAYDKAREYEKLIRYFMAALVIPNKDMWVNLSPEEANRIIPENFSTTEMGHDLLAQDYVLKQFTATLMYPEDDLGRSFWKQVYERAYDKYGTTDIPVDTFNKVWIMADQADIYQKDTTAFLVKSHLKVMLEQDFVAMNGAEVPNGVVSNTATTEVSRLASDIVRNVIVPAIEKEVNEGANFAPVRQAYSSMILATWFKNTLKDSLLGQIYTDQNKVEGIDLNDPQAKDAIYEQYLKAYRTGVFDYIKEEYDAFSQETLPRKYFSGGTVPVDFEMLNTNVPVAVAAPIFFDAAQKLKTVNVNLSTTDGQSYGKVSAEQDVGAEVELPTRVELPEGNRGTTRIEVPESVLEENAARLKALGYNLEELGYQRRALEQELGDSAQNTETLNVDLAQTQQELEGLEVEKKTLLERMGDRWASAREERRIKLEQRRDKKAAYEAEMSKNQEVKEAEQKEKIRIEQELKVKEAEKRELERIKEGRILAAQSGIPFEQWDKLLIKPQLRSVFLEKPSAVSLSTRKRIQLVFALLVVGLNTLYASAAGLFDSQKAVQSETQRPPAITRTVAAEQDSFVPVRLEDDPQEPIEPEVDDGDSEGVATVQSDSEKGPVIVQSDVNDDDYVYSPNKWKVYDRYTGEEVELPNFNAFDMVGDPGTEHLLNTKQWFGDGVLKIEPGMLVFRQLGSEVDKLPGGASVEEGDGRFLRYLAVPVEAVAEEAVFFKTPAQQRWEEIRQNNELKEALVLRQEEAENQQEDRGVEWREGEALKGREGLVRQAIRPPTTAETVEQQLAKMGNVLETPEHKTVLPVGAMFIPGEGQARSYFSSVNPLGGGNDISLVGMVATPLGDVQEAVTIASAGAKVTPVGWVVVGDDILKIFQGISSQDTKGSTTVYHKDTGTGRAIVDTLLVDTSVKAYHANEHLEFERDREVRIGLLKTLANGTPRLINGIPLIGKYISPLFGDAKGNLPWENIDNVYEFGLSEVGFYKDAYQNQDGSFAFLVAERNLTLDVVAESDKDEFGRLIDEGWGYAEGYVIHENPDGTKEKRIAFRRLCPPNEYRDGYITSVISVEEYRARSTAEIQAYNSVDRNGTPVAAIVRDKLGKIISFHGARDIPVLTQEDVDNPNTGMYDSTSYGGQLQFWLHHEVIGDYLVTYKDMQDLSFNSEMDADDLKAIAFRGFMPTRTLPNGIEVTTRFVEKNGKKVLEIENVVMRAPESGKLPIGAIMNGNKMRVYFDNEVGDFTKEAMFSGNRAIYGANYSRVLKEATGGYAALLNPETGEITQVEAKNFPVLEGQELEVANQQEGNLQAPRVEVAGKNDSIPQVVGVKKKGVLGSIGGYVGDQVGGFGRGVLSLVGFDGADRDPVSTQNYTNRYQRVEGVSSDVQLRVDAFGRAVQPFSGVSSLNMTNMQAWVTSDGQVLIADQQLTAEHEKGLYNESYVGVAQYFDGRGPQALQNMDGFIPAEYAKAKNVEKQENGRFKVTFSNGAIRMLEAQTMLLVKEDEAVAILEIGLGGLKARTNQLTAEAQALEDGGTLVKVEQEDGTALTVVVARGNATAEGLEQGIWNEVELVQAMAENRVSDRTIVVNGTEYKENYVSLRVPAVTPNLPVEMADSVDGFVGRNFLAIVGQDKKGDPIKAWVSKSKLEASRVLAQQQAQADVEKVESTLTGSDGQPVRGVTIDAQTFDQDGLNSLRNLGDKVAVRAYYPIPVDVAVQMAEQGNVDTIVVNIPLSPEAYEANNMSSYFGEDVPEGDGRISLEGENYLDYIRDLKQALDGKAKLVVELLNEPNMDFNYPQWTGQPANDATFDQLFSLINTHARNIHKSPGLEDVVVTTVIGDRPEHFAKVARLGELNGWGVNSYRHHGSISADLNGALAHSLGKKFAYISEAGESSYRGEDRQADVMSEDIATFEKAGLGWFMMSLRDTDPDAPKYIPGSPDETSWGIAGKKAEQVVRDGIAGRVVEVVVAPGEALTQEQMSVLAEADQILKLDAQGNTIGFVVKAFEAGFQEVSRAGMPNFLASHWLGVAKDATSPGFVSLDQLKDPGTHEKIRLLADSVEMQNTSQEVVGRVYLNSNIYGSRIEIKKSDSESLVFELLSFSPYNLANPVSRIQKSYDGEGFLHVRTQDLRPVNEGVIVEDVYKEVEGQAPIKLYSNRFLQQERIYFNQETGRESYSVSLDTEKEPGFNLEINGENVEGVTGLFQFDGQAGVGYHINLRDSDKNGGFFSVRRSTFSLDGDRMRVDEKGFLRLDEVVSVNEIHNKIKNETTYQTKDVYTYQDGFVIKRDVAIVTARGAEAAGWKILGDGVQSEPELVKGLRDSLDPQLRAIERYLPELKGQLNFDINRQDILTKSKVLKDKHGIETVDYRLSGDILESKQITVRSEGGKVIDIIVGLDFDERTGEQILAVVLTPDYQVDALRITEQGEQTVRDILPEGIDRVYERLQTKNFEGEGGTFWDSLNDVGVSETTVPTVIKHIPFIIESDTQTTQNFDALSENLQEMIAKNGVEGSLENLIKQHNSSTDEGYRNQVRENIESIVRASLQGHSTYTARPGHPRREYLIPNDSRGRPFMHSYFNGNIGVADWSKEGEEVTILNGGRDTVQTKVGVLPSFLLVNESGEVEESQFFKHERDETVVSRDGQEFEVKAYEYYVMDSDKKIESTVSAAGRPLSEKAPYSVTRVLKTDALRQVKGDMTAFSQADAFDTPLIAVDQNGDIVSVPFRIVARGEEQDQILEIQSIDRRTSVPDTTQEWLKEHVKDELDIVQTTFRNKNVEDKSVLGIWGGYLEDLHKGWKAIAGFVGSIFITILLGLGIGKTRFIKHKLSLNSRLRTRFNETKSVKLNVDRPDYKDYGFNTDEVGNAKNVFESSIISRLERGGKNDTLEAIYNEYFRVYNVWREDMEKGVNWAPTINDLWLMILIMSNADVFSNDTPGMISYFFNTAKKFEQQGRMNEVAGFIRQEYERWHQILLLQNGSFQAITTGSMHSLVAPSKFIHHDDVGDFFRMKNFIDWYDGLAGAKDAKGLAERDAIYGQLMEDLKEKVDAVSKLVKGDKDDKDYKDYKDKEFMLDPGKPNNVEIVRLRNFLVKSEEYKKYVDFFKTVQQGDWKVDKDLTVTYQEEDGEIETTIFSVEVNDRINKKSMMPKTSGDVAADGGFGQSIKSWRQIFRNQFKAFVVPTILSVSGWAIAMIGLGIVSPLVAVCGVAAITAFMFIAHWINNWSLDKDVPKEYRNPPDIHEGFKKPKPSLDQTIYRTLFWISYGILKVGVNAVLGFFILIPALQMFGATSLIHGTLLGQVLNIPWLVLAAMPIAFFNYLDNFAIVDFLTGIFVFIRMKILGVGAIYSKGHLRNLQKKDGKTGLSALEKMIDEKILPSEIEFTLEQRNSVRQKIFNFIADGMYERKDVTREERDKIKARDLSTVKQSHIHKRLASFVNSLQMSSPEMPTFDNIKTLSFMVPMLNEDVVYPYDTDGMPNALDVLNNNGDTNLNMLARKNKKSWEAFIETLIFQKPIIDQTLKEMDELFKDQRLWESLLNVIQMSQGAKSTQELVNDVLGEERWVGFLEKVANLTGVVLDDVRPIALDVMDRLAAKLEQGLVFDVNLFKVGSAQDAMASLMNASSYENIMNEVIQENTVSQSSLDRMKVLGLPEGKGRLGGVSDRLKKEIRVWGSNQNQPYYRTLDGQMNYVRWLKVYAEICHPEWSEKKINEAVNEKVQMVWTYAIWDQILKGKPGTEKGLKKEDSLALLRKYKKELGFDLEIVSIQKKGDFQYKVLSVYDEKTGETEDKFVHKLTKFSPLLGEGKPNGQMHGLSFVSGEGLMTLDMNQDYGPEQVMKIPMLLEELNDPEVGLVDYPEVVDGERISAVGRVHSVFDRTFAAAQKEHMYMLGNLMHYGHPSLWRASAAKAVGGVSSVTHVNEDIIGGQALAARGWKIVNRLYIEAIKLREISGVGFEGINRKFGMGGVQQMLRRQMNRVMKFYDVGEAMAHHFSGPGFYMKQAMVIPTLFLYAFSIMFLGLGLYMAVPLPALAALTGLFVFGQSIVLKAYLLRVAEDGPWRGTGVFLKVMTYMTPIAMWNVFSEAVGAYGALLGIAKYVGTGRGFNIDHMRMDTFANAFAPRAPWFGALGLIISGLSFLVWSNATFVLSAPFILMFAAGLVVPLLLNRGAFPGKNISPATYINNRALDVQAMKAFIYKNTKAKGRLGEKARYYMLFGAWRGLTAPFNLLMKLRANRYTNEEKIAFYQEFDTALREMLEEYKDRKENILKYMTLDKFISLVSPWDKEIAGQFKKQQESQPEVQEEVAQPEVVQAEEAQPAIVGQTDEQERQAKAVEEIDEKLAAKENEIVELQGKGEAADARVTELEEKGQTLEQEVVALEAPEPEPEIIQDPQEQAKLAAVEEKIRQAQAKGEELEARIREQEQKTQELRALLLSLTEERKGLEEEIARAQESLAESQSVKANIPAQEFKAPEAVSLQDSALPTLNNSPERIQVDNGRVADVIYQQEDRLKTLNAYKDQLFTQRNSSEEARNVYRQVSTQIGILEKRTLPRLRDILRGDPVLGRNELLNRIDILKGMEGEEEELAQKKRDLAFVDRWVKAPSNEDVSRIVEAVVELSVNQLQALRSMDDLSDVLMSHSAKEGIRLFAGLTKAQKTSALKTAMLQFSVNEIVSDSSFFKAQAKELKEKMGEILTDAAQNDTLGGITMSDEFLTINLEVDSSGMPLPARFQNASLVNISGLMPVIRSIEPLNAHNMPAMMELMQMGGFSMN